MSEPHRAVLYRLGCDLAYEVRSPSTFVLDMEVARLRRHHHLVKRLALSPDVPAAPTSVPTPTAATWASPSGPGRFAAFALRESGHLPAGHGRATQICNWIYDNLDYRRGASTEQTKADGSLLARTGVRHDFAHLASPSAGRCRSRRVS